MKKTPTKYTEKTFTLPISKIAYNVWFPKTKSYTNETIFVEGITNREARAALRPDAASARYKDTWAYIYDSQEIELSRFVEINGEWKVKEAKIHFNHGTNEFEIVRKR